MKEIIKKIGGLLTKKALLWLIGTIGVSGFAIIGLALILLSVILGAIGGGGGGGGSGNCTDFQVGTLSPHVQKYESTVRKYAREYDIEQYTPVVLAIMQQESGGNPSEADPMQSSESLCGRIGCITNPEHSIAQGLKHFNNVLEKAEGDLYLAIQSYNFGTGFINYVKQRNGKYAFNKQLGGGKETYDLAVKFSQEQYNYQASIGNGGMFSCLRPEASPLGACYGDILYVWSVLNYVSKGEESTCDATGGEGMGTNSPNAKGWVKPFIGNYPLTSNHGWRDLGAGPEFHAGVDYGTPMGTPVYAAKEGTVSYMQAYRGPGWEPYPDGFGAVIFVDHGDGIVSIYAHLSATHVKLGDKVKQNQNIGKVGHTGRSTAPHLHFEVRINGQSVPPLPFIQ